jgi:hypothetical protein
MLPRKIHLFIILLLLAWPILGGGARAIRVIVVAAVIGLAILKFADRF